MNLAGKATEDAAELVGEGFAGDAGVLFTPRAKSVFVTPAQTDEQDLVEAAKEDAAANEQLVLTKSGKPSRASIKRIASKILNTEQGGPTFAQRIEKLMQQTKLEVPTVTVEYQNLTVEADALLGAAGNPTVGNAFKTMVKHMLLQGGLSTQPFQILKGIDGVIKPGRLTLLLGPPGSGKSVFLQTLAGRLRSSKSLRISGSLKFNGVPQSELVARRTIGLVEQYDHHIPNLTVLETVNFAARCQTSRAQSKAALEAMDLAADRLRKGKSMKELQEHRMEQGQAGADKPGSELQASPSEQEEALQFDEEFYEAMREVTAHRLKPFLILQIMGLDRVADTPVGNEMLRGVSGGERKRVTTAEILAGPQSVVMFDDISSGLDSATTFSVIKAFGEACHALRRTFVISLLQPPPEVFYLFDDVMILTEGRVQYHGPVSEVLPYFNDLGFSCPLRKDPGSFLQEVTTPLGQLLYATPQLLDSKGLSVEDQDPVKLLQAPPKELLMSVENLSDVFWSGSKQGKSMLDQLYNHPFDKAAGSPAALMKERFANGWAYLSLAVLRREITLNNRMRGYFVARIIQTIIMGLIIGSLFLNIQPSLASGRNVLAVCTLSVMFLAMMSGPSLGMVFQTKRVFYKHRDANFFPSMSYAVALLLVQLPQSTIESVFFSVIVYFLVNFSRTAGQFFTYLLVTWSASNSLGGLFRLFAFASPTMVLAQSVASLLLLLMMLTNGFSIVVTSIPWYIRWIYYMNPLAWAMKAIIINEMTSERWSYPVPGYPSAGAQVLDTFGIPTDRFWIWAGVGFQWGALAILTALGSAALRFMNPPAPQPTVPKDEGKKSILRGVRNRILRMSVELSARSSGTLQQEAPAGPAPGAGSSAGSKVAPLPEGSTPHVPQAAPDAHAAEPTKQQEQPKRVAVPFTPIALVCRDIRYYVNDPSKGTAPGVVAQTEDKEIAGKLELLKGISMYTRPGQLTALMGGSGAGKTTLMDVICGRKTQGIIRGEILVNSHPKEQATWSRVVGYVEQQDNHSARTTVKEALLFSARLRLDESITMEQVTSLVEDTLDMVELRQLEHSIVGEGGGGAGLSNEQRKRLSIAVELVANPSVIFMDEPTSGLDARAAAIVMRAVKNVARSNRTVMTTIHQPSMEIFEAFDMLVLLQRGGRLTYFGPLGYESCDLIRYLEGCPGVEPIKAGYNPATWMLEVTGGSMTTLFSSSKSDFPALYAESELQKANEATMAELSADTGIPPLSMPSKYATSMATQRKWLVRKFWQIYWNSPSYNFVRLIVTTSVAILYGLTYLNQGRLDEAGVEVSTVQNIMGLTFSQAIFLGMLNTMTVMPLIASERTVYYRERAILMYSPAPYSTALSIAEVPYIVAQAVIMVGISYWMVGYQAVAWKFFYFLLMYILTLAMYTSYGTFLIYMTPSQLMAQLLAAFINQLWSFFNGFLIPYPQIPKGWKWLNRISPTTYILYGLAGSQLTDRDIPMTDFAGKPTTVSAFMDSYFGYSSSFIWWNMLIVLAYVLFFRVGAILLLRFVNFERR